MSAGKKILLWFGGAAAVVLALLAAALLLAPAFINSPKTKESIRAAMSREAGGEVTFQRLDFSLFPRPHAVVRRLVISIPKRLAGSVESLSVYPRIFPLLKGKVLIAEIRSRTPDFTVTLGEETGRKGQRPFSLAAMKAKLTSSASSLESIAPGLVLRIENGTLVLVKSGRPALSLRNVNARLTAPPEEMEISIKADTDRWGAASLHTGFSFDRDSAEVKDLSGSLWHSSVSGLSARLSLKEQGYLDIFSGTGSLSLADLSQWRSLSGSLSTALKNVNELGGTVILSSINVSGPLSPPAALQIKITGTAENVVVDSKLLPALFSLNGQFDLESASLAMAGLSASLGRSSVSGVSGGFRWGKAPQIEVLSGTAVIFLNEVYRWRSSFKGLSEVLKDVKGLKGTVRLSSMSFAGPLSRPRVWQMAATGNMENVVLDSPLLPGPAALSQGKFSFAEKKISFSGVRGAIVDSSFLVSGALQGFPDGFDAADLSLNGNAGREIVEWAFRTFNLPHDFAPATPMDLSRVRILWQKKAGISLVGNASIMNGPTISIDFVRNPEEIAVRRATIKDQKSNATLSFTRRKEATAFSFSGSLAQATVNSIFIYKTFGHGKIRGDLHANIVADRPGDSSAQGNLEGNDVIIPLGLAVPVRVDSFVLHAGKGVLTIDSAKVTWGDDQFSLNGDVSASQEGLVVDMNLASTGVIQVDELRRSIEAVTREKKPAKESAPSKKLVIRGMIQFKSPSIVYGRYMISPVQAVATIGPEGVSAAVTDAEVCGLSIPGTIVFSRQGVQLNFKTSAEKQKLESSILCLSGSDVGMTGTFDLSADVSARGKSGALLSTLEGKVDFRAKKGKIYRYPLLAKIFSVLSVTEIFRGKLPELGGTGFSYNSMTLKGKLHNGKLELEEMLLDGSTIDIIAQGDVDIDQKKMDLVVLVAPFSTINWIIRHIPLVGKILGGTLISIPVKVSGDLSNPDVTFLAPSAVGSRILEILKNIVELPVEIISPVLPKEKESEK